MECYGSKAVCSLFCYMHMKILHDYEIFLVKFFAIISEFEDLHSYIIKRDRNIMFFYPQFYVGLKFHLFFILTCEPHVPSSFRTCNYYFCRFN